MIGRGGKSRRERVRDASINVQKLALLAVAVAVFSACDSTSNESGREHCGQGAACGSTSARSVPAVCPSDAKPLKDLVLTPAAVPGSRRTGPETFDLNDGYDVALVALEDRLAWDPSQFVQSVLTVGKGPGNGGKAITSVAINTNSVQTARRLLREGYAHLLPPFGSFRGTAIVRTPGPTSLGSDALAVHEGAHDGLDRAAATLWVRGKRLLMLIVDAPRTTNPEQLAAVLAQRQDQIACA